MTAVIGILNKQGITMAADSAVTVTGGNRKKIYNTANKLFTLSKHHPVGIMIYNNSSFMSTPWEIIIKLYRKNLKEKCFDTVENYKNDFLQFLKANDFYTSEASQLLNLKQFMYWQLTVLRDKIIKGLKGGTTEEELLAEFQANILTDLQSNIDTYNGATNILSEFADYTQERFVDYASVSVKEVSDIVFESAPITEAIFDKIIELYYNHLRTTNFIGNLTGIVFGGYGEQEIYPSIVSIKIAEVLDNRLRYFDDLSDKISDENNGSIMPFAQTDVINMFIKGIDPELDYTYLSVFEKFLRKYNDVLIGIIEPDNQALADNIRALNISTIVDDFRNELSNVKTEKQIIPTVDTVAILSKEDLAEMAESLIYLTYLKRRISSSEESVGGPIDVAIISKGDGFIWKKRKHYFEEGLNKHFTANYFKN